MKRASFLASLLAATLVFAGCMAETSGEEEDESDSDDDRRAGLVCEAHECVRGDKPTPNSGGGESDPAPET